MHEKTFQVLRLVDSGEEDSDDDVGGGGEEREEMVGGLGSKGKGGGRGSGGSSTASTASSTLTSVYKVIKEAWKVVAHGGGSSFISAPTPPALPAFLPYASAVDMQAGGVAGVRSVCHLVHTLCSVDTGDEALAIRATVQSADAMTLLMLQCDGHVAGIGRMKSPDAVNGEEEEETGEACTWGMSRWS
jgi:hypothetical protein